MFSFFDILQFTLIHFFRYIRHFDKEKTGRLNHQEFKSCLRALGYDLPMVEEGQVDPEFEAIIGELAFRTYYEKKISYGFFLRCC